MARILTEPLAQNFIKSAEMHSRLNLINPTGALKDKPIFIHSNTYDTTVRIPYQWSDYHFYKHFGANVNMEWGDYSHEIPAVTPQCFKEPNLLVPGLSERFQPNCGQDTVGNMFRHVLGNLKENPVKNLKPMDNDWKNKGVLRQFDVNPYLDTAIYEENGLDDQAYIYYPYSCIIRNRKSKCKLHFVLHGCQGQMNGLAPWD